MLPKIPPWFLWEQVHIFYFVPVQRSQQQLSVKHAVWHRLCTDTNMHTIRRRIREILACLGRSQRSIQKEYRSGLSWQGLTSANLAPSKPKTNVFFYRFVQIIMQAKLNKQITYFIERNMTWYGLPSVSNLLSGCPLLSIPIFLQSITQK